MSIREGNVAVVGAKNHDWLAIETSDGKFFVRTPYGPDKPIDWDGDSEGMQAALFTKWGFDPVVGDDGEVGPEIGENQAGLIERDEEAEKKSGSGQWKLVGAVDLDDDGGGGGGGSSKDGGDGGGEGDEQALVDVLGGHAGEDDDTEDDESHGFDEQFESKHPRDGGKFSSKPGVGARPSTATVQARQRRESWTAKKAAARPSVASKAGKAVAGAVGAAISTGKDWRDKVKGQVDAQVSKLPKIAEKAVRNLWAAYGSSFTVAQSAVAAIAKEKKLSPDHIETITNYVAVADWVVSKIITWTGTAVGLGPLAKAVAGFVPLGSLAYLSVSTATSPIIALRAIKRAVSAYTGAPAADAFAEFVAEFIVAFAEAEGEANSDDNAEFRAEFVDWITSASDPDFAMGAFLVALDESGGDWEKALSIASHAADDHDGSNEPSTFAESDWFHDPTNRTNNRWKHKKTGRIVYAKANPGISKAKPRAAAKPAKPPASPPPSSQHASPHAHHVDLASEIAGRLKKSKDLPPADLWTMANTAYGGTRAEGKYGPSDAYDALEAGVNLSLEGRTDPRLNLNDAIKQSAKIQEIVQSLPTQTNRSGNKDAFQQFSTPPHLAYAVAWAANIGDDDIALEPSAGTGSIAVQMKNAGAAVHVNELDPRRAAFLASQFGADAVTHENAEQIGGILPRRGISPTVVVMNPPFSQTAGRLGSKKVLTTAAKHIDEALLTLQPGGRLVAIVGRGMSPDSPTFKDWYAKIGEEYNIRASVGVSGKNYTKYGTSFDNRVIVIDKTPHDDSLKAVTGDVETIPELMAKLEGVRNDRHRPGHQTASGQSAGGGSASRGGHSADRGSPGARSGVVVPGNAAGAGGVHGAGAGEGGGAGRRDGSAPGERSGATPSRLEGGASAKPASDSAKPSGGTGRGAKRAQSGGGAKSARGQSGDKPSGLLQLRPAAPVRLNDGPKEGDRDANGLVFRNGRWHRDDPEQADQANSNGALGDSLFEQYRPTKAAIVDAVPHNTAIVESAAMAAVDPPDPTYLPVLSPDIVSKGVLSDAQLEAVLYAGQAHSKMLGAAEGQEQFRRGFFIGDGTGVGKGREIAGVIADNMNQGRKKHVWVSLNNNLFQDAQRDVAALGLDPETDIFEFGDLKKKDAPKDGVAFITYGSLRSAPRDKSKQSNLQELIAWLGKDFDGVIAFDEAHTMGNAIDTEGARGMKGASATAIAGVDLQKALPNARVLYVSATGATEVSNLAFAERLGVWGYGKSFADKKEFIAEMQNGGVAAMEAVAQSLKASGAYMARSLSFDGIGYSRLTHHLSDEQKAIYNTACQGWQKVLQHFDKAIEDTGADARARGQLVGQFWNAQQRFFNQVITSLQTPAVIAAMEADIKAGKSPVVQLVNTNEASLGRAVKAMTDDQTAEDLDVSPKQILVDYLKKSFPTERFEEYEDDNGNIRSRPVKDANGLAVHDPAAVELRDALLADINTNLRAPDSPIDLIVNHFGHENVAECTGRSQRKIYKTNERGKRELVIEDRNPDAAKEAETDAFQSGRKKILVFSDAGGTGRSYHADLNAKNQSERVHYLLQPGWRADRAVQGLGRTHRTNEKQPPTYRLVEIEEIKGQKRFVSTIARRLDQLGALTRGQRQAGSTGLFKASDNLESREASQAMTQLFDDLHYGKIPGIDRDEAIKQMGLRVDERNRTPVAPANMNQFMNRMLVLDLDKQGKLFDEFDKRLKQKVDQAIIDKTLDTGVENYPAERLTKKSAATIYRDPDSGAHVKHYVVDAQFATEKRKWDDTQRGTLPLKFVKNNSSGQVWAVYATGDKTDAKTGAVTSQYKLVGPKGYSYKPTHEVDSRYNAKYSHIENDDAKRLWTAEHDAAPSHTTSEQHFITGALLPVWDRLPKDSPKIYRLRTDDGNTVVGRYIHKDDVPNFMQRLGVNYDKPAPSAAAAHGDILAGARAKLANGWRLKPSMVQHEKRIEIVGPTTAQADTLAADGVIKERIGYEWRFFIPSGARGSQVLERITKNRPITEVDEADSFNETEL